MSLESCISVSDKAGCHVDTAQLMEIGIISQRCMKLHKIPISEQLKCRVTGWVFSSRHFDHYMHFW